MKIGDSRWKASLLVVCIFVLGFLTGALTANLMSTASSRSVWQTHESSEQLMERLSKMLDLTAEQREAIRGVLDQTKQEYRRLRQEVHPRFRDIRNRSRDRIRAVLNPKQREIFEAFVRRHDEEINARKHKK